jgi:hypothetical protein
MASKSIRGSNSNGLPEMPVVCRRARRSETFWAPPEKAQLTRTATKRTISLWRL